MFRHTKRLQQKWRNLVFWLPERVTTMAVPAISRELKKKQSIVEFALTLKTPN